MRTFSKYWDEWGLLAQKPPKRDGGDSAQRLGMYYYAHYLYNKDKVLKSITGNRHHSNLDFYKRPFEDKIDLIHNGRGLFRRHPDFNKWYSDWNRMSRDQMTPIIVCMGAYGLKRPLLLSILRWILRLGFMNNTRRNFVYETENEHLQKAKSTTRWRFNWKLPDLAIIHLPLYVRSFRAYILWPLLLICDFELLLGAITKATIQTGSIKSGDDLNYIIRTLQAKDSLPTPISWLARQIYKTFRPHMNLIRTDWVSEYTTRSGPQSALQYYCLRNKANDPPLDILYKSLVEGL